MSVVQIFVRNEKINGENTIEYLYIIYYIIIIYFLIKSLNL